MPVFECQSCEYLTNNPFIAKIHNEQDLNHTFKRIGEPTYTDIIKQGKFNKIDRYLPPDIQKEYEEAQRKLIKKYRR